MAHELDPQTEWQRLYELYHAMSDEDLIELAESPDDLTDIARDVIGRELGTRQLQVKPPPEPVDAFAASSKPMTPGLVWLDDYNDAFEARFACQHLQEAGIEFEIHDFARPRWGLRAQGGPAVDLHIYVDAVDHAKAKSVLHDTMGRFPMPEVDREDAKKWVVLNTFFDALDASRACDHLEDAGIPVEMKDFSVRQQGADRNTEGPPIYMELHVLKRDFEAATDVLRRKMGLFPLQEVAEADEPFDDGTKFTLGYFDTRDQAEEVTRLLDQAGIWNRIVTPSTLEDATEECCDIEVREVDIFKANALYDSSTISHETDDLDDG